MNQPTALTLKQLENVYDGLAQAIDQAKNHARGDKAELFLTKLCLLLGNELADDAGFARLSDTALRDL